MNSTKSVLKTIVPVEVEIDGKQMADLFWQMCSGEQSEFFNQLATKDMLAFQLQEVTDSPLLTSLGRSAMGKIGDYSTPSTRPK